MSTDAKFIIGFMLAGAVFCLFAANLFVGFGCLAGAGAIYAEAKGWV